MISLKAQFLVSFQPCIVLIVALLVAFHGLSIQHTSCMLSFVVNEEACTLKLAIQIEAPTLLKLTGWRGSCHTCKYWILKMAMATKFYSLRFFFL